MMRFNTFNMMHKALRAWLYDTALNIQQTYWGDDFEAEFVLANIEAIIEQFENHANHEDNQLMPAIAEVEPEIVASFEAEHERDHILANQLLHLVNIYRAAGSEQERVIAGSAISKAFVEFMIFNLQHMAKEEVVINQALWKYYSDEEIMAINQRIAATLSAEEKAISSKWMMRGVNKNEAILWLQGIRRVAPAPVFNSMIEMAETELPKRHRNFVKKTVTEFQSVEG